MVFISYLFSLFINNRINEMKQNTFYKKIIKIYYYYNNYL